MAVMTEEEDGVFTKFEIQTPFWIDSQKLSAEESEEVLAFLRTVRRILLPLMAVYYLYEIFALLSQVWINDVYEVSLWMAVFWLVAVPGQMFYLFNCKLQKKVKLICTKKQHFCFA